MSHRKTAGMDSHSECNPGESAEAPGRPIRCGRVTPAPLSATGLPSGNPVARVHSPSDSPRLSTALWGSGVFSARQRIAPKTESGLSRTQARLTLGAVEPLGPKRRRLAAQAEAAQAELARRARPAGVNALGHDEATQTRMGLAVLEAAFARAAAESGVIGHPRDYCLEAGQGGIAAHYALRLLGHLEPRPYALVEVLQTLESGIRVGGGEPPPWPKGIRLRPKRKPGPKVSRGPPSEEEVARRRTLLAAALGKIRLGLAFLTLFAGE